MKLPVYELQIDEVSEAFVDAIAIVESPAIESNFIAFSKDKQHFSFNDEKMELLGAAMIPNQKIYRRDANGFEYEVFFTVDTIRKISQLFFKKGFQANMNIEHTNKVADSYVFQSYIVDTDKGLNAPKGLELPNGSWVVGVKVQNKEVWEDIKAGKRKGFSVEGVFELIKQDFNTQINKEAAEMEALLQELVQLNKILEQSSI